jgi:hypothetical protein
VNVTMVSCFFTDHLGLLWCISRPWLPLQLLFLDVLGIDHESTAYNTANTMSTIDCLGQPDVVSCGIEVSNEQNVVLPNMVANDVESSENLCLAGVSAVESQPASTAVMPCNAAVESKPKLQGKYV